MNSLHRSSSCSLFKHVLSFVVILFSDEDVTKDSKKSKEKKKKEQLPVVTYSQSVERWSKDPGYLIDCLDN